MKTLETKVGFFQFKIIIIVLVGSFWFIWILVLWVYGHFEYFYFYSVGIDFTSGEVTFQKCLNSGITLFSSKNSN